jgi:hypothetical protein
MRIEWSDAGRVSARRFMRDRDGLRAVGLAFLGLADDPYSVEAFHRAPTTGSASAAIGSFTTSTATSSLSSESTGSPDDAARRKIPTTGGPLIGIADRS